MCHVTAGGNELGAASLIPICAAYKAVCADCTLEALELFGNNHEEDGTSSRTHPTDPASPENKPVCKLLGEASLIGSLSLGVACFA